MIFVDDHEPAHVHVFGDGHAKINLFGPGDEPELVSADQMKRGDLRHVMKLVGEHRHAFLLQWQIIHG